MSTTTPTTRPRAGSPTVTKDPDRWSDDRAVTTANAPRTFEYGCAKRMPNTADEANESVPR